MAVLPGPDRPEPASPLQLHVIATAADAELGNQVAATLRAMGAPAIATLARQRDFPPTQRTVFCLSAAALADAVFMAVVREHAPAAAPHARAFFLRFDEAPAQDPTLAPLLAVYPHARAGDLSAILAWFNAEADAYLGGAPEPPTEQPTEPPPEAPRETTDDRRVLPSPSTQSRDHAMLSSPPTYRPRFEPAPRPSAPAPKQAEQPQPFETKYAIRPEAKRSQPQSEAFEREPLDNGYAAPRRTAKQAKRDRVDARAYCPKKLRAGAHELIRVALFRPKDRDRAAQAARRADPSARRAGAPQALGRIARGVTLSAVIESHGAVCATQRLDATWTGAPLDFDFIVEVDPRAPRAAFIIRILSEDAQIGIITFVRDVRAQKRRRDRADPMHEEKLRRVERVFLSYSSQDRQTVSLIASAYHRAGIPCFFDRASLKSGEEWSPRLKREIDRADLFHLCWSKSAAASRWVHTEAEHALKRRRKSWSSLPDITIQMLDGPPWAPHPARLDALNFDDYARAAIVGYARGEG
ncbi:MAG: toll/interleukin-1 receptor domain-containing protein [Hyphomonadaceae bacterium]|nr:toll/interleukin-1 receptor domain-containing protein [Hyphomonadaceae bacterium]